MYGGLQQQLGGLVMREREVILERESTNTFHVSVDGRFFYAGVLNARMEHGKLILNTRDGAIIVPPSVK